ncbi:MAG: MMPL family transporter [Acetobacteraceae bacterium]
MKPGALPHGPAADGARRRAWPVLLALAAAILILLAVLSRISVRTDMVEFLPAGQTAAARLVMDEARAGTATGLILVGLEGADPAELARISKAMAAALPATGLFQLVAGGEAALPPDALEQLFARRYLLAPAEFGVDALRAGMEGVLRQLRSSAAPLATQFGLADPPGAFLTLIRGWAGSSTVRSVDGAWFAAGHDRALLLARTRAGGMDVPAQETATGAIAAAFAAARPGPARLLVAGPAVFARDAARAIHADVQRISILSTLLIAALLWWRFRSPLVIAAIAAPVVLSVAVAAAAVQLGFGSVHGVALGFGATMLGVSVDYPVLMIGHRKRGEPAAATRARIGPAFILAVITATLGLGAMLFSGFPGLAQLGVFSAVGLATCALATWFGLPLLIVAANLAPVAAGDPAWLPRLERVRRWRWLGLVPVLAAAAYFAAIGGPHWEGDLANLSPVPAASRALDQALRAELGAPDAGQILLLRGPDAETVLQRQEALLPMLDRLRTEGVLAGADAAATLLPSQATQRARVAALPDPATLAARIEQARAGLPFRPEAFRGFAEAVAATRNLAPLRPEDLADTPVGARLDPLLTRRGAAWQGPIVLHGVTDAARLAAALGPGTADVTYIDMRGELGAILAGYTARAWRWLGCCGVLVVLVLGAGLRRPGMTARVLGAVLAAMLVTAALLTGAGVRLSLIHLVALQLVAGVGLDYALFFARRQLDAEERARTLRTLVTCNAMTLLTFGLLSVCDTPVLRDIGVTVAVGAVLAMGFAFFAAGQAPGEA